MLDIYFVVEQRFRMEVPAGRYFGKSLSGIQDWEESLMMGMVSNCR
jgi:hypothetical protein